MNARLLREMTRMMADGWRPYTGDVESGVYEALGCDPRRRIPYWLHRWPLLHCLGCARRCTPKTSVGFQAVLPCDLPLFENGAALPVPAAARFSLTPEELIARKNLLRVDEVAYCLGISERQAYRLADEGVLVRHVRQPWRVTAESVREEMNRVDL
jgi:predicted DNA-binding transcriptional regulator AlpA